MLTGWGDESGSQPDRDPGVYILAAALIDEPNVELVRKSIADFQLSSEVKPHWHGSSGERRLEMVHALLDLPIEGFLAVVHHDVAANDRRRRRKCLEGLLPRLEHLECGRLTLESRGGQDQSDRNVLDGFRSRRVIVSRMSINHARGNAEPVLAVADIVCGAIVQARVGKPIYRTVLGGMLEIHED